MDPPRDIPIELQQRYGAADPQASLRRLYGQAYGWTTPAIRASYYAELQAISRWIQASRAHRSRQASDWWNKG